MRYIQLCPNLTVVYLRRLEREREPFSERERERGRWMMLVGKVCCVKVALNGLAVCYYGAILKMLGEVIFRGFTVH